MKHLGPSIRLYLFFTLLVGAIYPLAMTGIGRALFPRQVAGSLIEKNGIVAGSELIAQKFEGAKYFWPRPSATDYNPLPSGGSNLGPTSQSLKESVAARKLKLGENAPEGLLFSSASGLDPHIDLKTAEFQIHRVAEARGVPEDTIRSMVLAHLEKRDLGFLGEEKINVLLLNLSLDDDSGEMRK